MILYYYNPDPPKLFEILKLWKERVAKSQKKTFLVGHDQITEKKFS